MKTMYQKILREERIDRWARVIVWSVLTVFWVFLVTGCASTRSGETAQSAADRAAYCATPGAALGVCQSGDGEGWDVLNELGYFLQGFRP